MMKWLLLYLFQENLERYAAIDEIMDRVTARI